MKYLFNIIKGIILTNYILLCLFSTLIIINKNSYGLSYINNSYIMMPKENMFDNAFKKNSLVILNTSSNYVEGQRIIYFNNNELESGIITYVYKNKYYVKDVVLDKGDIVSNLSGNKIYKNIGFIFNISTNIIFYLIIFIAPIVFYTIRYLVHVISRKINLMKHDYCYEY